MTAAARRRLARLADRRGILRVLAIDHRDSLKVMIDDRHPESVPIDALRSLKTDLAAATAGLASGVMLDPELGMDEGVVAAVPPDVGIIAAREAQGYLSEASVTHTTLMPAWDARSASAAGADAIKLLALWNGSPSTDQRTVIDRAVDEAHAAGMPLVLEPLPRGGLASTGSWVRDWAEHHRDTGADVFKLPYPGSPEECSLITEALDAPWTMLSAGADFEVFLDQVGEALAAGASGYIVGRAVWREAATLDRRVRTDAIRDQVIPRLRTLEALPGSNGITIR